MQCGARWLASCCLAPYVPGRAGHLQSFLQALQLNAASNPERAGHLQSFLQALQLNAASNPERAVGIAGDVHAHRAFTPLLIWASIFKFVQLFDSTSETRK